MLEWLKRHVWKACGRQKRLLGSNPSLSANKKRLKFSFSRLFLMGPPGAVQESLLFHLLLDPLASLLQEILSESHPKA